MNRSGMTGNLKVCVLLAASLFTSASRGAESFQTAEHQLTLARAAFKAGTVAPLAEAVETATLMGANDPALPAMKQWLSIKATELFARAMTAQAAGDLKTAVKSYLVAIKCDRSLLANDDRGLRGTALGALRRMADKHPEKPALRFQLGFYSWLCGDLPAAREALAAHETAQTDPYLRWRGQLWLQTVSEEAARSAAQVALAPKRTGGAVDAEPEAVSSGRDVNLEDDRRARAAAEAQGRKRDVERELAAINSELTELGGMKASVVPVGGQLMLRTFDRKKVKERMGTLNTRKSELEAERDSL